MTEPTPDLAALAAAVEENLVGAARSASARIKAALNPTQDDYALTPSPDEPQPVPVEFPPYVVRESLTACLAGDDDHAARLLAGLTSVQLYAIEGAASGLAIHASRHRKRLDPDGEHLGASCTGTAVDEIAGLDHLAPWERDLLQAKAGEQQAAARVEHCRCGVAITLDGDHWTHIGDADPFHFPKPARCPAQTGPVWKADGEPCGCTLAPGHEGDHLCGCGAWWVDSVRRDRDAEQQAEPAHVLTRADLAEALRDAEHEVEQWRATFGETALRDGLARLAAAERERDEQRQRAEDAERERDKQRHRADQLDELLNIANDTANRSERARADAARRADEQKARAQRAEAAVERARAVLDSAKQCQGSLDPSERIRCRMCGGDHFAEALAALGVTDRDGTDKQAKILPD